MIVFVLDPHPIVCEIFSLLIHRFLPHARVFHAGRLTHLNGLIDKHGEANLVVIDPQSIDFLGSLGLEHISQRLPNSKVIFFTDMDTGFNSMIDLQSRKEHPNIINKRDKVGRIYDELHKILCEESTSDFKTAHNVDLIKISKRHRQLICMLDRGLTNKEISSQLGISQDTVKVHFYRLNKILGTKNRLQILNYAKSNGWILKS